MNGKINKESIWDEQIVYEDNHIIVINKMPSEIDPFNPKPLINCFTLWIRIEPKIIGIPNIA